MQSDESGRCMHIGPTIVAAVGLACAWLPQLPAPKLEGAWAVREIAAEEIRESSGLVKSRRYPNVYWTHNDSGDRARFFAIDGEGKLLAEFAVSGARNLDWEDVAVDAGGHLFFADFGNNHNARRDLVVYRVAEPDPRAKERSVRVQRALRFRYADQHAYPEQDRFNFDAEALYHADGALWILTKHRSDAKTTLYRLPDEKWAEPRALEPLQKIDLGRASASYFGTVTGADVTPDGRRVAVLSYFVILVLARNPDGTLAPEPLARIALNPRRTGLVEGIAWDGAALLFTNEARKLFRIPEPLAPGLVAYPP